MTTQDGPLLRVENLVKHFPILQGTLFRRQSGAVHAVDGISFDVQRGEILGLVGESGCGKSVTGLAILNIVPQGGEIAQGRILLDDSDILKMNENQMQKVRGRRISMIFQDPSTSLNPVFTVGSQTVRVMILRNIHAKIRGT